jgi:hypothetical protein
MFRGAVMRALQPYGRSFAIVVSSLLFAVYHLNFFQLPFTFLAGLLLAYCAMHFSLKWSILLHILNNGLAMGVSFLEFSPTSFAILLAFLAIGLVVIVPIVRRWKMQLRFGRPTPVAVVSETAFGSWATIAAAVRPCPYAMTFSSPLIIVGLCLAFGLAVFSFFTLF